MKFRSVIELYEDSPAGAKAIHRLDTIGGAVSFIIGMVFIAVDHPFIGLTLVGVAVVFAARFIRRENAKAAARDQSARAIEQMNSHRAKAEAEARQKRRTEEQNQRTLAAYEVILARHLDLLNKFLEITERKVSVLDEYGDENWDALPEEIYKCLSKIAKREPTVDLSNWKKGDLRTQYMNRRLDSLYGSYRSECAIYLARKLDSQFRAYHEDFKRSLVTSEDISNLAGEDFETYVSRLLKMAGFDSVVGTPKTGDQGADLLAKKNGRTIAIQAKGYRGAVGNAAVQEIVGALKFYKADEGWVVTTSTFTTAARTLAQANGIKLIDGHDLKNFKDKL